MDEQTKQRIDSRGRRYTLATREVFNRTLPMSEHRKKQRTRKVVGVIHIHTDGGCVPNPGKGACAAIIQEEGKAEKVVVRYFPMTTNNRMEIKAVILGLESLPLMKCKVVVHTDSQYVVNTMESGWKRKVNGDLWDEVDFLASRHNVRFQWVKGHAGDTMNERCDRLVQDAIERGIQ